MVHPRWRFPRGVSAQRLRAEAPHIAQPRDISSGWQRLPSTLASADTGRAMSQENVDAMRKVYEAMARGDFWAAREVLDTEIEWSWPSSMSGLTGVKTYHGIEGVEAATRDVFKAWEMFRQEAEEFIEEGDDVVVVVRMYGRLKGSGRRSRPRPATCGPSATPG
jgi:ketosteroid isomerase-like protein